MSDEVGKTVQAPGTPTAAQKEQNNQPACTKRNNFTSIMLSSTTITYSTT